MQARGWGYTQNNLVGRLSSAAVSSGSAATIYGYDSVGRIALMEECTPSNCGSTPYPLSYIYDLAGDLHTSIDGAGVTSTYTVTLASELSSLTSSLSNSTNPPGIVSSVQNGPNGPVIWSLGNGLSHLNTYDTLGRLNGRFECIGSTSAYCSGGTQVYGVAVDWTGSQLKQSSDSALGQISTYGYDGFNRLASRTVTYGVGPNYAWVYDRYGNRWQQNVTAGLGLPSSLSFNAANNQVTSTGVQYDAAGNVTQDGTTGLGFHNYTYDAEGNITAVDGGTTATYTYDALNHRVRSVTSSGTTEFVFNASGQRVSEWNASTHAQLKGHYYWGGAPVAFYAGGAAHFQHQDWRGTERVRTTYNGGVEGSFQSLPFGDGFASSGSDTDANHYATLDHDSESDTEHAQFRQYSSAQGHWLSPDPYDGSYDLSNPQSLNRYAYALNNPLSYIDPLGLVLCDYGPSDNGGGDDSENADDDNECTTNGGTVVTVTATVGVNGDNPSVDTVSVIISGIGWSQSVDVVKVGKAICNAIPSGRVLGATASAGPGFGGTVVGGEAVMNYNSGQTSLFGYAGVQTGCCNIASAGLYTGLANGLNANNANYSGGFTSGSGSYGPVSVSVSRSSNGFNGPPSVAPPGTNGAVTTATVGAGEGINSQVTAFAAVTNYSNPIQLPKLAGFTPLDLLAYTAKQACQALGF